MLYGDEKVFHMMRSILPSTYRLRARQEKARINRTARHINKALLKVEDHDNVNFESTNHEHSENVQDRRSGDKLGHFISWAEAITKDVDQDDRLSKIRGMLPSGTIGRHALSHLRNDHFLSRAELEISNRRYGRRYSFKDFADNLPQILHWVIVSGFQKDLNNAMKEAHSTHTEPYNGWVINPFPPYEKRMGTLYRPIGSISARCLMGVHDIQSFIKDVKVGRMPVDKTARSHHEWYSALTSFAHAVSVANKLMLK